MKRIAFQIFAYTLIYGISNIAVAAGNPEVGKTKSAACVACHMPDGNSVMPEWPKLAGQLPLYLVSQLKAFKSGERVNAVMAPMVKPLSEQDMEDIAAYFSSQTITAGVADQGQMAVGEKLYKKGEFYTPLTACIGCHGMDGQGNRTWEDTMSIPPTVLAPAIGGQHAAYLVNQLQTFRSGERNNDVGQVMQKIAQQMSNEQINAVSQYITQLQ
ncbi:MAG: cytochrome c4 [Gammaproteobacteria bacterium]|nr:cytochrome c4 [Gammaproteobacteria bacterium]